MSTAHISYIIALWATSTVNSNPGNVFLALVLVIHCPCIWNSSTALLVAPVRRCMQRQWGWKWKLCFVDIDFIADWTPLTCISWIMPKGAFSGICDGTNPWVAWWYILYGSWEQLKSTVLMIALLKRLNSTFPPFEACSSETRFALQMSGACRINSQVKKNETEKKPHLCSHF